MGLSLKYGSNTHIVSLTYNNITYSNVGADALSATLTSTSALPKGYPSSFDTYCVDLNDDITVPTSYWVSMQPVNRLANCGGVAWLYNQHANNLMGLGQPSTNSSNDQSAGLQIAIWKVLTDGENTNLGAGNFQYTQPDQIVSDANY